MPLYEYKCHKCGDVFEVMQKFADDPLRTHEQCGGSLERLLSAPALQFKGSGWYVTDYARAGNGKSSSDEKKPPADGQKSAKPDSAGSRAGSESSATPGKKENVTKAKET